jgi:hypothetical protein
MMIKLLERQFTPENQKAFTAYQQFGELLKALEEKELPTSISRGIEV